MAFKQYRFDVQRLWATPANDAEAPPCVAEPDRKACRRRVKRELREIGLPRRARVRGPVIDGDEMRRLWLAERCLRCSKCGDVTKKLARWQSGIGK